LASADINGLALLARNCSAGEIETVASGFHLIFTFAPSLLGMSALPLKADIRSALAHVR
jgi:hypothetical protein